MMKSYNNLSNVYFDFVSVSLSNGISTFLGYFKPDGLMNVVGLVSRAEPYLNSFNHSIRRCLKYIFFFLGDNLSESVCVSVFTRTFAPKQHFLSFYSNTTEYNTQEGLVNVSFSFSLYSYKRIYEWFE